MSGVYGNMLAIPRRGRGGALPEYQGGNQVYTPGTGVSARLSDSAAAIYRQTAAQTGQGLRDLARGIDTANRIGMAAYEDYSRTKATQLMVEYRRRVNDAMYGDGGLLTRKGEDAFTVDEELERKSEQIRSEVLKDYKGSLSESFFRMRVQEFDDGNLLRAKKYKRDQYDAWSTREDEAAADMFADEAAANYGSPDAYMQAAAQSIWHIRQTLERKGYGPEAIEQAIRETKRGVFDKAFKTAMAAGDLDGAERLLGGGAMSLPSEVSGMARTEAERQGVDPALVAAVIAQESGGRQDVVSSAGARGLMQLMPGTAKGLGVDPNDPAQNVRGGVTYLRQMLSRYGGNVEYALMAYNWGPSNVDAWLRTGRGVSGQDVPRETRNYVPSVLARMSKGAVGLSSAERDGYRKQIETARRRIADEAEREQRRQIAEAATAQVSGWLSEVAGRPEEEQAAFVYGELNKVKDVRLRSAMERMAVDQMRFDKQVRDTRNAAAASSFADRVQKENLSPLEARKALMELPEEAREVAWGRAYGQIRENAANRSALDDVLTRIDTGEITNKEQIETVAFNARLTNEQVKKARTYLEKGGNDQGASISKVKSIYKELENKDELPDGLYDAVLELLPPGKTPTEQELRKYVANALMKGDLTVEMNGTRVREGWFAGSTFYEAHAQGRASDWRVDVTAQEAAEIHDILRAQGVPESKITYNTIREYKQNEIMGLPQGAR